MSSGLEVAEDEYSVSDADVEDGEQVRCFGHVAPTEMGSDGEPRAVYLECGVGDEPGDGPADDA
jgi:hypothetical protein